MKNIIFVFTIIATMLVGCVGIKTGTKGLESESYLVFIGNPEKYKDGVEVFVNDLKSFNAQVSRKNRTLSNETVYAVPIGKKTIVIYYNKKVIYKKTIFTSTQETRTITL